MPQYYDSHSTNFLHYFFLGPTGFSSELMYMVILLVFATTGNEAVLFRGEHYTDNFLLTCCSLKVLRLRGSVNEKFFSQNFQYLYIFTAT